MKWLNCQFKKAKRWPKALAKVVLNSRQGTCSNHSQTIFSIGVSNNWHACVDAHIHKDYPATRLTPGQTCSISVLTTVFTGSWLPNQYCRLRYTTPQLGHSITYLQERIKGRQLASARCWKSRTLGGVEATENRTKVVAAVLTLTKHIWQGPAKGSQWKQRFLAPRWPPFLVHNRPII